MSDETQARAEVILPATITEEAMLAALSPPSLELAKAMRATRSEIKLIPQSGHNDYDNYDYSTIEDYIGTVEGAAEKHGILIFYDELSLTRYQTPNPKTPIGMKCRMAMTLVHVESGESRVWRGTGDAWDRGDKAIYKAKTGARKYLLQDAFDLCTSGGEDDPERDSVPEVDPDLERRGRQARGRMQDRQNSQRRDSSRNAPSSQADDKPKEPKAPPINYFKKAIDEAEGVVALTKLIEDWAQLTPLVNDWKLWCQVSSEIYERCTAKVEAGTLTAEENDSIRKLVDFKTDAVQMMHDAKKPAFNLESVTKSIEACQKGEGLLKLIEKAEKSEKFAANLTLFNQFVERCGLFANAQLQAKRWSEPTVDKIENKLAELKVLIEKLEKQQPKETQGDLIDG